MSAGLICGIGLVAGYLLVALFGSHECFHGTVIDKLNYAFTDGIPAGLG
jgi:hypothetical protein